MFKLSGVVSILEHNGIEVKNFDGDLFSTNQGIFYLYKAKYRFHEVRETNIPFSKYRKLPAETVKLIVLYRDSIFLLDPEDIIKTPRLVGGKKVLPISEDSLIPLRIPAKKSKKKFTHLHLHSDLSLLDGVSSCKAYVEKAASLGVDSMALTDHGNMSGHMDFYLRCKASGIKPIFGVEAYFVDDATIKDGDHRKSYHIVLLAKDDCGYENLLKLQRLSWAEEHFYYRPRIDWQMLKKHSSGLVCLTACMMGLIGANISLKRPKKALKYAKKLYRIFGDDLYLEFQLLNIMSEGKDLQRVVNEGLINIAGKLDLPTVITGDAHYVDRGMHVVQDMIVKITTDTEMYSIRCDDLWFKTYEELADAHKVNCPYISDKVFKKSMVRTREIADKCNYEIPTGTAYFPKYKHKKHHMYEELGGKKNLKKNAFFKVYVQHVAEERMLWDRSDYRDRIDYEVEALIKTKSVDYLLIIDDLLHHMNTLGCLYHMRGSANGSLVCYLLGFGTVDPIKYKVMFERFISPGRILQGMQDIDIDLDFESEYRDIAIQYLKDRYGEDHICSVGTFGRLQLKNAIKRMAKVEVEKVKKSLKETEDEDEIKRLEKKMEPFSFKEINKVTKEMYSGDIDSDINSSDIVKIWYEDNKDWFERFVRPVIGNAYSPSIHPAGVVITPTSYDNWIPVRTQKDKSGSRVFTTQWENSHTYEEFLNERGIMILDVLGVKTLSIISKTIKDINKRHSKDLTMLDIPVDDPEVYKTLSAGENLGYFQLGKPSLKGLLRDLAPDRIEDLIFLSAADRPGALAAQAHVRYIKRKHGKEEVKYAHKSLKKVLKDTYGVIVYSEHIMNTATEFAGMTIVEAEELRQIIKAKDPVKFNQYKTKFIDGAKGKWGDKIEKKANKIWETFRASATYLFPLGHSTAYGLYGNATQWLKIHYPLEFFKNYLDYASDKEYPQIRAVARDYGIKFIIPSINFSKEYISIRNEKLVWSLQSIKGIGYKAAAEIVSKQPFENFVDFYERIDRRVCNIKIVTALIIVGACRKFGDVGTLIQKYFKLKKQGLPEQYKDLEEVDWQLERNKIVSYSVKPIIEIFKTTLKRVDGYKAFIGAPRGRRVVVAGAVTKKIEVVPKNKKNSIMWLLTIEDVGMSYGIVFWDEFIKKFKAGGGELEKGNIVVVSGYKNKSPRGEPQLTLGREVGCYVKVLR